MREADFLGRRTLAEATRLMEKLIARKLALFADEKRPILGFELVDRGGGQFYLTVTSEIPADDPRARPLFEAKGLLPPGG
jgi:hypothetical protein